MRRTAGFTLIELLVSVILMIILLSAVTLIFVRTTDPQSTLAGDGWCGKALTSAWQSAQESTPWIDSWKALGSTCFSRLGS